MNKTWPVKSFPYGKAAFSFVLLLSVAIWSPVSAQTTYWLPTITKTDSATTYTYDVKAPDYFGAWLTKKTPIGGGDIFPKTIDGKEYRFIKQTFSWYKPMSTNGLNIETAGVNQFGGGEWVNDNAFKTENAVIAALESNVIESSATHGKAMVLALIHQGDTAPGLIYIEKGSDPAVQLEKHKQIMGKLAENLNPGTYYPSVKKPADLLATQQEMLRYGNLGRRNPDFRKQMGSTTATNLEGDSVQTQNGSEKVCKTSPNSPYFRDHTLREDLNNAAQFQAEYQATIGQMTHEGPGSYVLNGTNRKMSSLGQRTEAFAGTPAGNWEACGGGPPGNVPNAWMKSETHFRPWFNVGDFHGEVGYGAAQAANGTWYYAAVGVATKDSADAATNLAGPTQPMSPQPSPAQSATANATPPSAATQTKTVHKQGSGKFDLYVTNKTGQALILFWVDGDCTEAQTPTTVPPDAANFNIGASYPGHLFRFKTDNQLVHSWVIQEGQPNLTIER